MSAWVVDPLQVAGMQALTDFYRTLSIDSVVTENIIAYASAIQSPYLNVAIVQSSARLSVTAIGKLENFFGKYGVGWSILVTPLADLPGCEKYNLLEAVPGMFYNLSLDLPLLSRSPLLVINELSPHDDLSAWVCAIREGFPSDDEGEAYRKLNVACLASSANHSRFKHFVAFYEGSIAGAGTLFLSSSGAMLHNIATRNDFRKLGIGTALTVQMMSVAKQLGYDKCFLDSSVEGSGLYERLGFNVYGITRFYSL